MSIEVWVLYVSTVLLFMVTPGPSHLLMLSNSMRHGFKRSLATAAGDLTANALQMFAAGIGLAALLVASQHALTAIKLAGVAYLLWMGIRMWRSAGAGNKAEGQTAGPSVKLLWFQGFFTSAANPKAVVFFAAFFPQFISAEGSFLLQFALLSLTYLAIDGLFLTAYGAGSHWIARKLAGNAAPLIEKIGAGFLIGAAIMLGLKSLSETK